MSSSSDDAAVGPVAREDRPWVVLPVVARKSFAHVLEDADVLEADAASCGEAMRRCTGRDGAKPGDRYAVLFGADGRLISFEYGPTPISRFRAIVVDEPRRCECSVAEVEHEVATVAFTVASSVWSDLEEVGESWELVVSLAEALRFEVDLLRDIQRGDRFGLFVNRYTTDGGFVEYGPILALECDRVGEDRTRVFWWGGQRAGYYSETGVGIHRSFLRSPLEYSRVSSAFGFRRHPILGVRHFHGGVDYAAPVGTPVRVVAAGIVRWAGWKGPSGKMVHVAHEGGVESYYLHLSEVEVSVGERVRQGDLIGRVGSTGRSTGPHLDFRLKQDGKFVDPRALKAVGATSLAGAELTEFLKETEGWRRRLDELVESLD